MSEHEKVSEGGSSESGSAYATPSERPSADDEYRRGYENGRKEVAAILADIRDAEEAELEAVLDRMANEPRSERALREGQHE